MVEKIDGCGWSQRLVGLTEKSIFWYPFRLSRECVTYICGEFPNAPLISSKGCINYNPSLTMIQLGYPILYKLDDKDLESLLLLGQAKKFGCQAPLHS